MREYARALYQNAQRDNLTFLAASISFFALFSLFPLVLFLIAGSGYFFAAQRQAESFVISQVGRTIPQFVPLVRQTVRAVIETRGQVTFAGALVLLWAGTAVFDALEYALDQVMGANNGRRLWRTKLVGIAGVIVLGLLLALITISGSIGRLAGEYFGAYLDGWRAPVAAWAGTLGSVAAVLLTGLVLWMMYKLVPNAKVTAKQAALAAAFSAVSWEIAKRLFGMYLTAAANFTALYGSLGIIIGLLASLYVLSFILLIGAEVAALSAQRD